MRTAQPRHLLLISNSTCFGQGYLEHCGAAIREHLAGLSRVLFVPYALFDRDAYAAKVAARFAELGFATSSIHQAPDPVRAVEDAEAVFIGGGNTFRLLKCLWELGLVEPLRARARAGMPYVGSSAGSNVATVSIRTTNDMPIVEPPSFEALGLVPFNLNPHFLDTDPNSKHMGETREERLAQFHEENDPPVLGLREGAWLKIEGAVMTLLGTTGGRLFVRGKEPREIASGVSLDDLLDPARWAAL